MHEILVLIETAVSIGLGESVRMRTLAWEDPEGGGGGGQGST